MLFCSWWLSSCYRISFDDGISSGDGVHFLIFFIPHAGVVLMISIGSLDGYVLAVIMCRHYRFAQWRDFATLVLLDNRYAHVKYYIIYIYLLACFLVNMMPFLDNIIVLLAILLWWLMVLYVYNWLILMWIFVKILYKSV